MEWSIHTYTAGIDTAILVLLCIWAWMDRNNIYFGK
jgi:hypothetical protein